MLPKKWRVDIKKHGDYEKTVSAHMAGKITDTELMAEFRRMKFDLVPAGYQEYVEKKRQKELARMFG